MGVKVPELTQECLAFLEQYPWPGNVRQLENALYRAVSLLDDEKLGIEHLQLPSFTNDLGYLESDFEGSLESSCKTV